MSYYLNEVRKHLSGIPTADVDDMMQYWDEYFYDAGLTDGTANAKYGTPKRFAQTLKMTYFLDQDDATVKNVPQSRFRLVWLIIVGLFASPILIPLAIAVLVVIFALLISLMAIIFSIYAVVFSLIAAGILGLVMGIAVMFQSPATGLVSSGIGLASLGVGLVLAPFLLKLSRLLFELFIKFVKWLGRKIAQRRLYHAR